MNKSITLPIAFYTNEHLDFPENITLDFSEEEIKKIKKHLQYSKDNDVCVSMDFSVDESMFEDFDFMPSVELLKIYPSGYICYYAQHKWSSADQIETATFKLKELVDADN